MSPEDVEKIVEAILPSLQETVRAEIADGHKGLSDQITGVKNQVTVVTAQVKPMVEVYTSISGFGSVIKWFLKNIVMPLATILGILLAYNSLKK